MTTAGWGSGGVWTAETISEEGSTGRGCTSSGIGAALRLAAFASGTSWTGALGDSAETTSGADAETGSLTAVG